MAYRVQDVFEQITHELGGKPKGLSPVALVNDAGARLVNMHGWTFLSRPPTTLTLTAGQSYVLLPSGFSGHIKLDYTDATQNHVCLTTMAEIQRLRTSTVTSSFTLYCTYSWYVPTGEAPQQRLEIWPTPATTQTGALTLWYRVGWQDVSIELDAIPVPPYCRPLFTEIARSVAMGYHNPEEGTVDARLSRLRGGTTLSDAMAMDRSTQADAGVPGPTYGTYAAFSSIDWSSGAVLGPS